MGAHEDGTEVTESLKIGPAIFVKLVGQAIEIGNTIFENHEALGIKAFRTIEEIHYTSTDHRIQRHQRPLMLALHVRPLCLPCGLPRGITGHPRSILLVLQPFTRTQLRPIHPSAWNNRTASIQRPRPQNR